MLVADSENEYNTFSKKKTFIEYRLKDGTLVSGNVFGYIQLSAMFQIKCREYGLSDEQSLAVFIAGSEVKRNSLFVGRSPESFNALVDEGFEKIKGINFENLDNG